MHAVLTTQLEVSSVWLKEEFGPKAFFPDPVTATFQFPSEVGRGILSLVVNGAPRQSGSSATMPHLAFPSSQHFQSHQVTPTVVHTPKPVFQGKKGSVNVKVIQASVFKTAGGKINFEKLGQAFIDVNESTANVFYIAGVIEKKWGPEYVLVTADGLKIEDSSGTQGEILHSVIIM